MKLNLTLNGTPRSADVPERTLLADLLRDTFGMTGTHVGCDTTQCGCCTVHVDGQAVKSCTMLAMQADGCTVTTIEGLGANGLHPVQQAFSQFSKVKSCRNSSLISYDLFTHTDPFAAV